MEIVYNNPYRILGVWAGETDRAIIRQKTKARAFLDVNKEIKFDTDLKLFPVVKRTERSLEKAHSDLEKMDQKITNALFWFTNFTEIDNLALSQLSAGNIKKASEIWSKVTNQKTLNERKLSALNNLGTLRYSMAIKYEEARFKLIASSLELKSSLLELNAFGEFAKLFSDDISKIHDELADKVSSYFFEGLKKDLLNSNLISAKEIGELIQSLPQSVSKSAEDVFAGESTNKIETSVYKAKEEREISPQTANKTGKHLYSRAHEPLNKIKLILGHESFTYKMLADKVALELIDCSVGYYNHHTEGFEVDPGEDALLLLNKAEQLAVGGSVKKRLSDNKPTIKEWVDNKPDRERLNKVSTEIDFIYSVLESQASKSPTVTLAKDTFQKCLPKLRIIEDKLGSKDKGYINVSSTVVNVVQGILVEHINNEQNKFSNPPFTNTANINNLNILVTEALNIFDQMKGLGKSSNLISRFNENMRVLQEIKSNTDVRSSSSSGGGCYIATMAYGDYDHPQVLKLRKFRDGVLKNFILGRLFIKGYYFLSPKLVRYLGNRPALNKQIRKGLDYLITQIR